MTNDSERVSRILRESPPGDRRALDRVFSLVYEELRRLAHAQLVRGPAGDTISTTVLIHEAWMRLADQTGARFPDRVHFYAYAARVMRTILVDHARTRGAQKRGGGWQAVDLSRGELAIDTQADLVVAVDEALTRLTALDERVGRVVECRFFGGMTIEDTAEALGVSPATVKRGWSLAQAWLYRDLKQGVEGTP
jgi:RNA polymerase sigma factor (TIGR02999 family)